jgi:hypothetical protein
MEEAKASNIFNNRSPIADTGWSSSLGVGRKANTPKKKNRPMLEILHRTLELDGFFG